MKIKTTDIRHPYVDDAKAKDDSAETNAAVVEDMTDAASTLRFRSTHDGLTSEEWERRDRLPALAGSGSGEVVDMTNPYPALRQVHR